MIKLKKIFLLLLILKTMMIQSRAIHRPQDPNLAEVTFFDNLNPQKYTLIDSHIKYFPLFEAYNSKYLNSKKLPLSLITYRNQTKQVLGSALSNDLEIGLQEILAGKTEFSKFKILKKRDFNFKSKCGLIVLKFKDYPFVAKLFLETPRSLSRPYSKGILPMGMFVMGGSNRHLNGFTRIKNMENVQNMINRNPNWRDYLSVPRKWFWTPKTELWIYVQGKNVGGHKKCHSRFPAIYAVIADEIMIMPNQPPSTGKRNLKLCQDLNFSIDPNHNNFVIEQGTNKLVMYDTEHFPTLIGEYFKPLKPVQEYVAWYTHLACKFLRERIFAPKDYQRKRQKPGSIYPLY